MVQLWEKYCKVEAVRCLQGTCTLVRFNAENAGGRFINQTKMRRGGSVRIFRSLAIPASSTSTQEKDTTVNTEKSSVECAVNDDSVRTPPKNPPTPTNITLLVISVGIIKATYIIYRKESKDL